MQKRVVPSFLETRTTLEPQDELLFRMMASADLTSTDLRLTSHLRLRRRGSGRSAATTFLSPLRSCARGRAYMWVRGGGSPADDLALPRARCVSILGTLFSIC